MFIEADKVQIRKYLGYSTLWSQADPTLESAMKQVQSVADGGNRPDNTTELEIKSFVTDLNTIDARLRDLWVQMHGISVDETRADPARGMGALRMEGRRLVHRLSRMLECPVRADVFSSAPVEPYC